MLCYVVLCKLRTFSRKMKFTFVRYYLHVCRLCNVYVKKVFFRLTLFHSGFLVPVFSWGVFSLYSPIVLYSPAIYAVWLML